MTKTDDIEKSTSQAKEILKKLIKEELLAEEEYGSPKQENCAKGWSWKAPLEKYMNNHIYIGVTAAIDRRATVRSLTRYLSHRAQNNTKNLDELKNQPTYSVTAHR